MNDRVRCRRYPSQREDRPEAERGERGEIEPAYRLGEVPERVRALIAVGGRVGQRADAARVNHEHDRPAARPLHLHASSQLVARGCALKYASFNRSAERWV